MRALILSLGLSLSLLPASVFGALVYSNDFDGSVQNAAGTATTITGGMGTGGGITGGITSSQGYDAFSEFGGDFWRITAPNDVLEFSITGVSPLGDVSTAFSLAMMDSWDGTSTTFGTDVINVAILDGTTVIAGFSEAYSSGNAPSTGVESTVVTNTQLGFNTADPFWMEDGYRIKFDNLTVSTGTLRIQLWGSSAGVGSGFQGGDDESFAIDNLLVTDSSVAVPEPSAMSYVVVAFIGMGLRRRRRRPAPAVRIDA